MTNYGKHQASVGLRERISRARYLVRHGHWTYRQALCALLNI